MLVAGLLICAASSALIPFASILAWLIVILCIFGVGSAVMSTAPTAMVGDVIGGSGGTPVAVFQMSSDLGSIVGPLAVGALADHYPLPIAFGIGAVLMAAIGIWSGSGLRRTNA